MHRQRRFLAQSKPRTEDEAFKVGGVALGVVAAIGVVCCYAKSGKKGEEEESATQSTQKEAGAANEVA